ncbi:MAG: hypothetical protein EHM91_14575 [Planctomycetota bacterium]|nr:MAG: hypothetical protein EHM91_14575 [Planctomycetota bacterium]
MDTAVNEAFLKRLSSLGGGTCTCVVPGEALEDALRGIGREIGAPLIVDVKVEGAEDLAPARVPDLFAGRAATVFLRVKKGKTITVTGTYSDGKAFKETVKPGVIELPAIAHLWARTRVTDLEDRFRLGETGLKQEIIDLAVRHTLLTRFTSFVVVDESEIVNKGGEVNKVVQPVHLPAKWEMEAEMCEDAGAPMERLRSVSSSMAPPPAACAPAPKRMSKSKKMFGFLGGKDTEAIRHEPEEKVSDSERKSFEKAVEALKKALEAAKAELEKGKTPAAGPVDQARKALLKELAGTLLGTTLGKLQSLLRSGLLELVAALSAKSATVGSVDRCLKSLSEAVQEGASPKFWEKMI